MAIKISGDTIIDDSRVIVNADKIGIGTTNPTYGLEIFSSSTPTGIALSATNTQSDDTNKAISVFNNSSTNNFSVSYRGRVDAEEYHGTFKGTIDSGVTISTDKIEKGNTKAQVVDSGSDGHFLVETEGTEKFRITGIGSVGIGEDDPDDLLSIKKSSSTAYDATATQSGGARLSIFNSDNTINDTFADIHFKCHSTSSAEARIGMRMPSVNKSELFFITENDNNLEERFLVQSNGNKIVKNGRLNINSTFIDFSGDVSTPQTAAAIFRPADNTLAFSTKNDERLRITSDGDVGIGTDDPTGSNALTGNNATLAVGIVTANQVFGTFRGDLVGTVNGLANVKDFGAKGDGTTDDYAAIQSAINSAKTVFFPAGTYKVGAALTVWESNSALIGHESLPTIKVVGTGYSGPPVSVQHSSNNINEFSRIENLKFLFDYDGGGPAPYSSTPNETNCGVSINGSLAPTASATNRVLRFKMENCRVLGFSNGINLKETTNTLIRRVVIEHEFDQSSLSLSSSNIYCGVNFDCTPGQVGGISPQASVELHQVIVNVGGAPGNTKSMGFRITGQDPRDIFFEGCETAHGNYGWFIDTSGDDYNIDVHINRPIIDAVDTTGIYVKDWLGYGALTINGGYVVKDANNSGAGIWVENSRGVNITGGIQVLGVSLNDVANDDGIRIKNSKICSVSSSTIMNCRYGISLEDSSNCSVTGNIVGAEIGAFTGGTNPVLSDAIRVFGNSDTNTITGNTIKGASSTYKYSNGILINASTCEENMISSNVIDDSTVTERLKDSGTRTNIFDVGRVAISTETGGKLLLGGGTGSALHFNDSSTRLEITAANNLSVFTSSVEGIRIDQNRDVGIGTTAPRDPVTNTNTSLLAVGIVTANTIFGNLEGDITGELTGKASKVDIANDGDNRIITATGSDTLNAEQNLTFDGSVADLTGKLRIDISTTGTVGSGDAEGIFLRNTNVTDNNAVTIFGGADDYNNAASAINFVNVDHSENYGNISFDTRGSGGYGERLRITGIGTLISTISSPDPFNTVNTNLHLVNTAGNQGAGSRIDFTAGNGKAHIQSQVTGANSNSGTSLVFATSPDANGAEERLRITGIGSVGINETSPASTLVVRKDNQGGRGGEISIVNYASGGSNGIGNEAALNFGLENSTYHADKGNAQIKAVTTAATNATDIAISNYSGSSFEERLRITSDGKFSLGTINSTPSAGVHIDIDSNNLLMLDNSSADTQKMFFAQDGGTHAQIYATSASGRLTIESDPSADHDDSYIDFRVDNDERLRIDSDGRVLIGLDSSTQSDSYMQVFKKTGNDATITVGNVATSASGLSRIDFAPSNKVVGARIECHATEDFSTSANRTADLVFITRKDGTNSQKLRIKSDGKVGIGTDDPSSLMHLLAENDRACVRLHNTADTPDNVWELQPAISGESNTGFSIRDVTDSTDRFVIDGSGNVGIGTNNPTGSNATEGNTAILAVGTLKADSISGTVSGTITNATTADNIKLTDNASDTECFLVFAQAATNAQLPHTNSNLKFNSTTGKLLLGANLEVNDGINVTSGVSTFKNQIIAKQDGVFATQGGVAFVVSSSSNTQMRANHFIVDDLPSGSGTYFIQATEVGVTNNRNIVLQYYGGKVGIGITDPAHKLDVVGGNIRVGKTSNGQFIGENNSGVQKIKLDTAGNSFLNGGNVGINSSIPVAKLDVTDGTTRISFNKTSNTPRIDFKSNSLEDACQIKAAESGGGGVLQFVTKNTSGESTERLRITSDGDVGIGTINPTGTDALTNNNTTLSVGKLRANNLEGSYTVPGETGQVFFNNSDVLTAASVLYWDEPNDRLGIGSVIPTQTLDIMSANPVIRLTDTDPAGVYSQIDGAGGDLILAADGGGGSSDSFISFRTDGTALSAEKVRIDSDGHLLVSTTKLSSQNGSIQAAGPILCKSYINSHTSDATVMEYNNGISRIRAYGATSGSGILAFNTGGGGDSDDDEALRITGIGSVGINATNPNSLLEVRGDAGTYTNGITVFTGNTTHTGSNAKNGVSLFSFGDALKGGLSSNLLYRNSSTPIQSYSSRSSGKIEIENTTAANKTSQIIFGGYYKGTTDFVETVRITFDGDVGIGTTNPTGSNATNGNNATLAVGTLKADTIEGDISGDLTGAASQLKITNQASDTTCFPVFVQAATGDNLTPHTNENLKFNSSTGELLLGANLDVSGNIKLSDTNPEIQLNTGGPRFRVPGNNTLTIHSGGDSGSESLERLRIDSAGIVGIAKTLRLESNISFGDNNTLVTSHIYVRGTGLNNNASRQCTLNGTEQISGSNISNRGLHLLIFDADNSLTLDSGTTYDTHGSSTASDNLATAIGGMDRTKIGVLVSYDAISSQITDNLRSAAQKVGLFKLAGMGAGTPTRQPYAAIFRGTSDDAAAEVSDAIEVIQSDDADAPTATISTFITVKGDGENATITGANSVSAIVAPCGSFETPVLQAKSSTDSASTLNIRAGVHLLPSGSASNDSDANGVDLGGGSNYLRQIYVRKINAGSVVGPVTGAASELAVTNQSSDETCFPVFVQAATGNLTPHTNANLTFNALTGQLGTGDLSVQGNTTLGDTTSDSDTLTINASTKIINDDRLYIQSVNNGGASNAGVGISFSDHVTTGTRQVGEINYKHADGNSPGDLYSDTFTFKSTEDDLAVDVKGTFLVDKTSDGNGGKVGIGTDNPLHPLHIFSEMGSSPSFIHMQVTGSNTVGGGGGIAFDTSASSIDSNNSKYLATIAGIRNSANNGSNDLVFSTTKGGENNNLPEEKLRITDSGAIAFNGASNYGTSGQILKSNGDAPPTWVNSSTISGVDVIQYKVGSTERSCDNPITVSSGTIGITSASNAYGARYISTEASGGTYCDGDIWYDTTGSETIQDTSDVVEANKFFQNPTSLTETTTFPLSGSKNGGVFGPYTIANGVTLTINTGSTFTIL